MLDFNSVCLSLSEWQFVNELARVTAPGGTIIIVTWCHRDLAPIEESLQPWEKELLNKICDSFYFPAWCSTAEYVKLLQSLSLQVISNLIILVPHILSQLSIRQIVSSRKKIASSYDTDRQSITIYHIGQLCQNMQM